MSLHSFILRARTAPNVTRRRRRIIPLRASAVPATRSLVSPGGSLTPSPVRARHAIRLLRGTLPRLAVRVTRKRGSRGHLPTHREALVQTAIRLQADITADRVRVVTLQVVVGAMLHSRILVSGVGSIPIAHSLALSAILMATRHTHVSSAMIRTQDQTMTIQGDYEIVLGYWCDYRLRVE